MPEFEFRLDLSVGVPGQHAGYYSAICLLVCAGPITAGLERDGIVALLIVALREFLTTTSAWALVAANGSRRAPHERC